MKWLFSRRKKWQERTHEAAKWGLPLDEEQKKYLQDQKERHEEDIRDRERFKIEKEKGRIPESYYGAPGTALMYLDLFDKGEIDQEFLNKVFKEHIKHDGYSRRQEPGKEDLE